MLAVLVVLVLAVAVVVMVMVVVLVMLAQQIAAQSETEKLKTFRIAVFIAQKLSRQGKRCIK